jgi:hypothetical protein
LVYRQERDEHLKNNLLQDVQSDEQALNFIKSSMIHLYENLQKKEQEIEAFRHRIQLKRQEKRQLERFHQRLVNRKEAQYQEKERKHLDQFSMNKGKKHET